MTNGEPTPVPSDVVERLNAIASAMDEGRMLYIEDAQLVRRAAEALASIQQPPTGESDREALLPAVEALLVQWKDYLDSDLNQMNAHDLLVRYELWEALERASSASQRG